MTTIYVNSANFTGSGNIFKFTYQIQPPLAEVKRVEVVEYNFTNGFYNIHSGNNTMTWLEENKSLFNITVPEGFYTASELATYLSAAMSGIDDDIEEEKSSTYTVTFDEKTQHFIFTQNSKEWILYDGTLLPYLGMPTDILPGNFHPDEDGVLIPPHVANLSGVRNLLVFCDSLPTRSQLGLGTAKNILFKIRLDKAFPQVCYSNTCPVAVHDINPTNLSEISISVRDEETGVQFEPADAIQLNWSFTLKLS